jgi:RimJ/RimL family protein N-acetyltransferase
VPGRPGIASIPARRKIMPSSRNARPSKKDLWFQCGRYFLRKIKREDASERWAGWLADPWTTHALNSPPAKLTKNDIVEYIKQFDQRSRLLLGVFERGTRLHVGFIRLDIDDDVSEAFVSAVIGEPAHRNRGATTDVFVPMLDYLFDTVGLERVRASILDRNQLTLNYLLKLGWQKDPTPETPIKSYSDGAPLERWSVSWTRDAYRGFRQTPIGRRILQRLAGGDRPPQRGSDAKR